MDLFRLALSVIAIVCSVYALMAKDKPPGKGPDDESDDDEVEWPTK